MFKVFLQIKRVLIFLIAEGKKKSKVRL